jgi:cytochrome d ubiquinol oxidase subunit II
MRFLVRWLWPALVLLSIVAVPVTVAIRPQLLDHYRAQPAGWIIPVLVAVGLAGIYYFTRAGNERNAFLSSCLYIVATLSGAAFALYPTLLPSSDNPANSITIWNAAAGAVSLSAGLIWWSAGMAAAVAYFVLVYSMFKGKVGAEAPAGH